MKEMDSLMGCNSNTSKYRFSPSDVGPGSGISSGAKMRMLYGFMVKTVTMPLCNNNSGD